GAESPFLATWWEQVPWLGGRSNVSGDNTTCFSSSQSTVLRGVRFGGVPVVLLLDFIFFLVLLFIFSIIRKKLWDYGRLALVSDSERSVHPEAMIRDRCGVDAVHYLSFQRHLITLMLLICVASVTIILPVNLSGNLLGTKCDTLAFCDWLSLFPSNNLLWLHTVFAVLYLALTVGLLRHHTSQMKGMQRETARNTLFISSVPRRATVDNIRTHFMEAYPTCRVTDVRLCYDVTKLVYMDKERKRAEKNLLYYQKVLQRQGRHVVINPRRCSYLCCCCGSCQCCQEVSDAIEYYSTQEAALLEEVQRLKQRTPERPLGMAFVTLQTESMATYILKDFNALQCRSGADGVGGAFKCGCCREPQPSSVSGNLHVRSWRISYAPNPNNIYWQNLSVKGVRWWLRFIVLNSALFTLLFFLTTPSIIITNMDKFNVTKPIYYLNSPVISQFFPTLLLWSFSALLPTVVYYSTLGEAHWTRSGENISMMYKLYIFLLFMVLILPSLGLTSLAVLLRRLFDNQSDTKLRFECVFLPDQGAFFVNYVIAAGLVGSGMELLRLPGLLLYTIRMAMARSAAERKYVKQNQAYQFEYGAMYGWTLCVFTVIMAYSITCPVIVPFGLLYLLLKHIVDKHNLYFTYLPSRLDRQVHLGAVNQALAAPIICLLWLFFFSVLRMGLMAETSLFTLVVLCATIFICIGYNCFGHFKYLSPHNYKVSLICAQLHVMGFVIFSIISHGAGNLDYKISSPPFMSTDDTEPDEPET
uniref:Transmembrane protein 63A n=1 Tax=Denticeps clupeoides TaxID=299321 RepID=A0AAY4DJA4_9TELE